MLKIAPFRNIRTSGSAFICFHILNKKNRPLCGATELEPARRQIKFGRTMCGQCWRKMVMTDGRDGHNSDFDDAMLAWNERSRVQGVENATNSNLWGDALTGWKRREYYGN